MLKQRSLLNLCALVFVGALTGCGLTTPRWDNPGTMQQQRNRAEGKGELGFDPFYDNDIATPIPDARPRDFGSPRPEINRSRGVLGQAKPDGSP